MAETTASPAGTTPKPKAATEKATEKKEGAKTTYLAFVWREGFIEIPWDEPPVPRGEGEEEVPMPRVPIAGWSPVMDKSGRKPKEYTVPSGQSDKVRDEALVALAAEEPDAKSFRVAVVSARFWVEGEFEMEPPPPPQFKQKGS